jgi:PBP1b-binding outer membrane lipoprotein LpoB
MAIRRHENMMRMFSAILLTLVLSSCSVLEGKPQPAPPVSDHPQEISRNQTQNLQEIGSVSVTVLGSPMDVEDAIKVKATEARADYYVILLIDDTVFPGRLYSSALLYRQ